MKAIQTALAASLFAIGAAHASEITDFPLPTTSERTRAEVQAEAQGPQMRYDFVGPTVTPMSTKSREEVRKDALVRSHKDLVAGSYFVGGM